jgi:hypothetical protein
MLTSSVTQRMSRIGDIASDLRAFLEPMWDDWKIKTKRPVGCDVPKSENMCGFSSAFTSIALSELEGGDWRIAGGWPKTGGGVACPRRKLNSHFWTVSDDGIVVDLTADQFNMPTIIVTSERDPRYIESFSADEVERYVPLLMPLAEEWIEEARQMGVIQHPSHGMVC